MKQFDNSKIIDLMTSIYSKEVANIYVDQINDKIEKLKKVGKPLVNKDISSNEVILITYGDSLFNNKTKEKTIKTLHYFVSKYLEDSINTIHILPFFPYTSDDGFSISDYERVNPILGDWEDIESLNNDFKLMFDLVANHVSKSHIWFKKYLKDEKPYNNYFITCDPNEDYSKVFRPRALPLLSEVTTEEGIKNVWTTFSSDQIDLNYQSPELLMEVLDVFCLYVEKGATYIRLDAIAYIWKELGTNCLHNEETHLIIQLIRLMVDLANIDLKIITETNVPHKENISYFGNGYNEASLVYNFPLPPLTLYTFMRGDASIIRKWASTLKLKSDEITFFNFLASHDGIGLLPTKGLVDDQNVNLMAQKVKDLGGFVSYKTESNGDITPYEMNINFFDALKISGEVIQEVEVKRFLASQSILLCLKGVPGIYIHSIIGSRNWIEGVKLYKSNRSINREKIEINLLEEHICDDDNARSQILKGYKHLLNLRKSNECFSPRAEQKILDNLDSRIFGLERSINNETIVCLTNVSNSFVETDYQKTKMLDSNTFSGTLSPFQVAWFKKEE
ncbi:MAG: sugar phosphorylase [Pleomorphochaeta sp.]